MESDLKNVVSSQAISHFSASFFPRVFETLSHN